MTEIIAEMRENDKGQWEAIVDGKVEMYAGKLLWLQNNFRRSKRIKTMGITKAKVFEASGESIFDVNVLRSRGPKPNQQRNKKIKFKATINNSEVVVVGLEQLNGYEKTGRIVEQLDRVIVIEFTTKNGDVAYTQEFDAKTGIQLTDNPFHIWKLPL